MMASTEFATSIKMDGFLQQKSNKTERKKNHKKMKRKLICKELNFYSNFNDWIPFDDVNNNAYALNLNS